MYTLYILRCADGTFYTGVTIDISRRLFEHNSSKRGAKYTRSRRPVKLVYTKMFRRRSTASRAEFRMKLLSRQEKQRLISAER